MTIAVLTSRLGASRVYASIVSAGKTGASRVRNDTAGYLIWISYGAPPDLDTPGSYYPTLPAVLPLTPPGSGTRTYYVVVVRQNQFGLRGKKQVPHVITINSSGDVVVPAPSPPVDVVASPAVGGTVAFRASYPGYKTDQAKATAWRMWVKSTAIDVDVDSPTGTLPVLGTGLSASVGTFAPGTYNWTVQMRRATDGVNSTPATGTLVVPALPATPPAV